MSAARQQGRDDQLDLFDEALLKALRHGAPGDGGTGPGACAERQALGALEQQRALRIGIGGRLAAPHLPHHRAYGSRTAAVGAG